MLKIRLARGGAKKKPFHYIVLANSHAARDGSFLEKLGTFDPKLPRDHENRIRINGDRVKEWLAKGAQMTDRVALLMGQAGVLPMPERKHNPKKAVAGAKMTERQRVKAEKAAAAAETAAEATATPAEAPSEEAPAAEETTAEETATTDETPAA